MNRSGHSVEKLTRGTLVPALKRGWHLYEDFWDCFGNERLL